LSKSRRCPYCQCSFLPSVYRPQQVVCSQAECQRQRRGDYHRQKLRTDPEYRQVARDSQRKWRQAHPDYLRQYLAQHAQAVKQNRQRQQLRDQKRRIRVLEKNNLAWDLKRSAAEVWLVGPRIKNLEKNNLASAQVFIFQPVKQQQVRDGDA
jgi:hypothetical protein